MTHLILRKGFILDSDGWEVGNSVEVLKNDIILSSQIIFVVSVKIADKIFFWC